MDWISKMRRFTWSKKFEDNIHTIDCWVKCKNCAGTGKLLPDQDNQDNQDGSTKICGVCEESGRDPTAYRGGITIHRIFCYDESHWD